jgi:hypothetical protein
MQPYKLQSMLKENSIINSESDAACIHDSAEKLLILMLYQYFKSDGFNVYHEPFKICSSTPPYKHTVPDAYLQAKNPTQYKVNQIAIEIAKTKIDGKNDQKRIYQSWCNQSPNHRAFLITTQSYIEEVPDFPQLIQAVARGNLASADIQNDINAYLEDRKRYKS